MAVKTLKVAIQATSRRERFERIVQQIKSIVPDERVEYVFCPDQKILAREIVDADVVVCFSIAPETFAKAQKLAWLHIGSTGVDHTFFPAIQQSDVLVTHAENVTPGPVAEYVFAALLYFMKRIDLWQDFMRERQWLQWQVAARIRLLQGRTMVIIGTGELGRAIAHRAVAFGMRVIGIKRKLQGSGHQEPFTEVYAVEGLKKILPRAEVLVLAAPLTPATRGMIGAGELDLLPPQAILINVGRGPLLKEADLIAALKAGKLAGAALDVYEREPLAPDSPLFSLPNVLLSPHIAGNYPGYVEAATRDFAHKLKAFLAGEPLPGVVDKTHGY